MPDLSAGAREVLAEYLAKNFGPSTPSRRLKLDKMEIDEDEVKKAKEKAERLLTETSDETQRQQALQTLRRSMIDLKVFGKIKRKKYINTN